MVNFLGGMIRWKEKHVSELDRAHGIRKDYRALESRITRGGVFSQALAEIGVTGNFPDILLYDRKEREKAAILVEIKPPGIPEDKERLEKVTRKAGVEYAVTWDLTHFAVWKLKKDGWGPLHYPEELHVCNSLKEFSREDVQARLHDFSVKLLHTLENLYEKGSLTEVSPPQEYFVRRLHKAVEDLNPEVERIAVKVYGHRPNAAIINRWAVTQAIPTGSDDFIKRVASHWVYKTIARSLFYLAIQKEFVTDLPPLYDEKAKDVGKYVTKAFEAASAVDWQAVFEKDDLDNLFSEGLSLTPFSNLLHDLKIFNFRNLPHDVIGTVFERLIPEDQRHTLGQYFTPTNLVDLMLGFVMANSDGVYCDPTCGTGTFLMRGYHRLKYLSGRRLKHPQLLDKLWGIDIAHFPAELATISLFRQDPKDHHNFPKIVCEDMFGITAGKKFKFPPATAPLGDFTKVETRFPQMTGLMGNFPYIRQELIEKVEKKKGRIAHLIAREMQEIYPDIMKDGADIRLSGQADIYAYMFFHVYTFLENGGRMAFLTSNSWLDTAYGEHLKRFFLRKFKIVAVVGSWVEPWFEDASVNTVFVVLERCDDPEDCLRHSAKFVRLNKPLKDLLPFNPETQEHERWERVDALVRSIESAQGDEKVGNLSIWEDERLSVRSVLQKNLLEDLERKGENDKWGMYIRAPKVYFQILRDAGDRLVPFSKVADIRFGVKTGINEFFYLTEVRGKRAQKGLMYVKNERGWEGVIEERYLRKAIKSPKDAQQIVLQGSELENYMFVCDKSKTDLRRLSHAGAMSYIEWGEGQRNKKGTSWPQVSSVRNRCHWHSVDKGEPGNILVARRNNNRFLAFFNKSDIYVGDTLYQINCSHGFETTLLSLMNSTIVAFFEEVHSRVNLGEGAAETEVIDWQEIHVPDKRLVEKVKGLPDVSKWERKILSIKEEVKQKDRQELDEVVLMAIGLDPKKYLPAIYDGLCQLVRERLELPKMRKKRKKQNTSISIEEVKVTLRQEFVSNGLRGITRFLPEKAINLFMEAATTGKPLFLGDLIFDKCDVVDVDGKLIVTVHGSYAGKFVVHQYAPGATMVLVPKENDPKAPIEARKALQEYEQYIRETREKIYSRALEMTVDAGAAERIADEILSENGYVVPVTYRKK